MVLLMRVADTQVGAIGTFMTLIALILPQLKPHDKVVSIILALVWLFGNHLPLSFIDSCCGWK